MFIIFSFYIILGIQQALNPGVNCANLQIGQVVCLYYTNFNALPCGANTYLYTIRPGDYLK